MSTPEPAASPLDGFVGSFTPPRVTLLYTCGLAAAAAAMLLLPIIYLSMIAAFASALVWYATYVLPAAPANFVAVVLYGSPFVAGAILVSFMLKPLLARRAAAPPRLSLDCERERLLVAFVERLCELLDAPRPYRIDVDLQPNASASLQGGVRSLLRRRLVLTIGLPLVAGLTTRELAGVLAHELSHFGQGAGMRFTYVISSINSWFARGAFERDKWDVWLANSNNFDSRLTLAMLLARMSVAVVRTILKGLLWSGHAISCFLLRQMEFDADRCQALLSGSNAFESCSRRVHGMALAAQTVGHELQRGWAQRELPDDVPYLVAQRLREAGLLLDRVLDEEATKPTRLFDTHPSMRDRLLAVRNLDAAGVFHDMRPASELFSNFSELSRAATRQFYEQQNHLTLDDVRLVPSESVLAAVEDDVRAAQAVGAFFEGTPFGISPLPSAPPRNTGSSEDLLLRLVETRGRMRRERAAARDAMRRYEASGVRLVNLTIARHLIALGVKLSQLPIDVRLEDVDTVGAAEAVVRAAARASAERDALLADLAPLERAAIERVETALALLPQTPGRLGADAATLLDQALNAGAVVNAIDRTRPAMRELHAGASAMTVLERATAPQFDPAAVKAQTSKLHDELMPILVRVLSSAGELPDPRSDAAGATVAEHVRGAGELTLPFALPRLLMLNDQCLTRVIEIVMAVEQAWQGRLAELDATSQSARS
jgi:Zn-dependent protease with chaperone function